MTEEHGKGTISDVKGNVKEGFGRLTGDEDTQAEGQLQQAQGEGQKGLGDIQQSLRDEGSTTDRDRDAR